MEPNQTPPPPSDGHPKRILLVEDDDALANVYVTRLQAEGFDVRREGWVKSGCPGACPAIVDGGQGEIAL